MIVAAPRASDSAAPVSGRPVASGAVEPVTEPVDPAHARWLATRHSWVGGRRRTALAAVFLAYLAFVGQQVADRSHGLAAVAGFAVLGAFAVIYLVMVSLADRLADRTWWLLLAALAVLTCAELVFAQTAGFVLCIYITAVIVPRMGARAAPAVVVMALLALFVPPLIGSWNETIGGAFDAVTPLAIPIVALGAFGMVKLVESNEALASARAEMERLGAENERNRIARDLHDLLGHSLTTITVKAGLAVRIGAADPDRALREMGEVEELARQSLADVRSAVSDYREVTLARELATAREVLRAAGVTADFPGAVDAVDPANRELFGWIVREGVTNVVRHAHASVCSVRLTATSVELSDDGVGGPAGEAGNGLRGLCERVASAGGTVEAGPGDAGGWRLRASVPAGGAA
jgi:two-component system, NarL family, sensor histidine kinase DesK